MPLSVRGAELPHVLLLRTLADCRALIAKLQASRSVVVGAGFIGLEAAASLRERNIDAHVVALEQVPMERVLGTDLGSLLRRLHEQHGVAFHLGTNVAAIDAGVTLGTGERIDADCVLVGIGVRPLTTLAERAGLRSIAASASTHTCRPAPRVSMPPAISRAGPMR